MKRGLSTANDETVVQLDFEKLLQGLGPHNPLAYELTKFMDFITLYRLARSENKVIKKFFRVNKVWQKRFIADFGADEFQKHSPSVNWLWMYAIYWKLSTLTGQYIIRMHKEEPDRFIYHVVDKMYEDRYGWYKTEHMKADDSEFHFSEYGLSTAGIRKLMYEAFANGFVLETDEDFIACRVCNKVATLKDCNNPTHFYCSSKCALHP